MAPPSSPVSKGLLLEVNYTAMQLRWEFYTCRDLRKTSSLPSSTQSIPFSFLLGTLSGQVCLLAYRDGNPGA